jgi:predicted GIY-YIG superfamily endonuclease
MVYLIHFDPPYKQAKHYLGWSDDVPARFEKHCNKTGARLTQVAVDAGCKLVLARTWNGNRKTERQIKNQKHSPRMCPICNPETAMRRALVK